MRMKKLLTFLTLLTLSIGVTWAESVTTLLNADFTGVTSTRYTNWENALNGVTFNGNSAKSSSGAIQMRSNNNNSGIVSTTSIGTIKKIAVTWDSGNTAGRTIDIYGNNSAYSSPSDLYNSSSQGTKIGSLEYSTTTTELTVTDSYAYIGLRSTTGAIYISQIVITWEVGGSTVETVATPTFSPAAGTYYEAQSVTLSCSTPGSTIHYTTDGTNPTTESTVFSSAIPVSSTTTIKAIATADGMDPSAIASATYTIYEPETVTPTYEQSLINGFGKFYFVDKTNPTTTAVWKSNSYGAVASGRISNTNQSTESWLYSPFIDLTSATNPEVSFSHAGNFFQTYMQTDAQVKVRVLNGTEWSEWSDLAISTWPNGTSWDFVDNTTSLSTYAGKKIQIAFRYTSSTSRAGSWEIKNFKIKNVDASAPSYYLVGSFNMNGNAWVTNDDNYKFEESNGTFTLNNVNLPANTEFKIIKIDNGTTWYGGTGDGVYSINHSNYNGLPMNGSQNYKIQSEGVTSFSFSVNNNTPSNLIVSRTAKLYIKGDFNSWNEEAMTATADGWTTTKEIAANNNFGFIDEFGQYFSKEWTIKEEHLNGYEIPMEPSSKNYVMQDGGTYTLNVNSTLTKLTVNKIEAGDNYTLVESVTDLDETSDFIIVSKDHAYAMSTEQRDSNRGATAITLINNATALASADTQVFKLEEDENGGWYFNTGSGYIYASSNSSNQLKTQNEKSANAKAAITITDGVTSIIFQGENKRNDIRFNNGNNPKIFSCYASTSTMAHVSLYKKGGSTTLMSEAPVITPASQDVKGGLLEDVTITAAEGATIYYTTDGSDPGDETNTNRAQYTEPFDIQVAQGGPQTVKAIAIETGKDPSNVVSVQYMFKNPDAPTFTPDPAEVQEGDFNVTISSTDGGNIYYVVDPENAPANAAAVVSAGQQFGESFTISGHGQHTVYAVVELNGLYSNPVTSVTYTIFATGDEGDWTLVTSLDDLKAGREYIIVNSDRDRTVGQFNLSVTSGNFSSLDCADRVLFGPGYNTATVAGNDVTIFTVEEENGNLYMKSGDTYYVPSTSGSDINTGKNPIYVSMNDGFVVIKGSADADRSFAYNYQSSMRYFASYKNPTTNGNQRPIYMYYRGTETPEYTEVTLAELCQNGVTTDGSNKYVIKDRLVAVYADDVKGVLWCKDEGNVSIFPTRIKEGQVDFLKNDSQAQNGRDWDQSNWIALQFSDPNATNNIGLLVKNAVNHYIKPGTIKGTYTDDVNYTLTMDLDQLELVTPADEGGNVQPDYIPNVYCTSNFLPDNLNIWGDERDGGYTGDPQINTQNYFFMNPKIQEVCEITYAQWDAFNGYFTVPSASGFDGAVQVGWGYNVLGDLRTSLQDEHIYKFQAIVQRNNKENYGPKNVTTAFPHITVYPVDLDGTGSDITTAINTVSVNGEVKSVKYVNMAGVVSDAPFQGVNIVVTEYTDGSRTTSKMLRK